MSHRKGALLMCLMFPGPFQFFHPVTAAAQKPHDLPGSLILSLSEQTTSELVLHQSSCSAVVGLEPATLLVSAVVLLNEHSSPPALLELLLFVVAAEFTLDKDGGLRHLLIKCILFVLLVTSLNYGSSYFLLLSEGPPLVLAEGSLDETRSLVQLSLLGVGQSQLGQLALHFAVGGTDEVAPVGRRWQCGLLQGALPRRGAPRTVAGVRRWGQGLIVQIS